MSSDILQVGAVSMEIVDFLETENFLFVATVCRQWRNSWGRRPSKTNPITSFTGISQLTEAVKSGVSLYHLCSKSVALGRTDLLSVCTTHNAPWTNAMVHAAESNDISVVKFMRLLGCPLTSDVFEMFSFKGNIEAMTYLMRSGCPYGRSMEFAAKSNNLTTLRWLRDNGAALDAASFSVACLSGNLGVIMWFERNEGMWDERAMEFAARSGNLEAVKLLEEIGFQMTAAATQAAAGLESMEILVWLINNGCPWGKSVCAQATKDGRLNNLIWAREQGAEWGPEVCGIAAKEGHFEILKWAVENGCSWDSTTFRGAAEGGHLDIITWAMERGCPADNDPLICASAASGGNLEILKFLRDKGFQWDSFTVLYGAKRGHFDVIEYCLKERCPASSWAVHAAVSEHRFQMVKFLVAKGVPVDEGSCIAAARTGDIQILRYFKEELGYVVGNRCLKGARKYKQQEMISWIQNQVDG